MESVPAAAAPSGDTGAPIEAFAAPPRPFWEESVADRWRERLANPRVRGAILIVVALGFGLGWFFWDTGAPGGTLAPSSTATPPTPGAGGSRPLTSAGAGASATESTIVTQVVVHVAGAVQRPGVLKLRPGSRVVDALQGAGGAAGDADLTRVNLAAPLSDGVQVVVPRVGEPGAGGVIGASVGALGGASTPGIRLNLNTATAAELDTLPGVGPTRAQQIVRERELHGPFRAVDDLQRVKGLGAARIADLRTRVQT